MSRLVTTYSFKQTVISWIILARPPFHLVGILPFILGTLLAYRIEAVFNAQVFTLGICGIILIMLSTYFAGEYFDYKEDLLSERLHKNRFAGGSKIIPAGKMPLFVPLWSSIACFFLAALVGVILQFVYKSGPWTFVLGCLGALPGFFYSTEPIRLVKRGLGELAIGFCYGWLPIAAAYYIQTSNVAPIVNLIWLPIGFSIINVILLNEFPDYEADISVGKRNILCRIGKQNGKALYIILNILTSATVLLSPMWGVPFVVTYFYLPFLFISVYIISQLLAGKDNDEQRLEMLCGLNIAVNLGACLSFIMAFA